jgi:hypothetical protein
LPASPGVCLVVKLTCDYATGNITGNVYDSANNLLGSVSGTKGSPIVFAPNANFGSPGITFTIQMSGPLNTEGTPPRIVGGIVSGAIQAVAPAAQPSGQSIGQPALKTTAVAALPATGPALPASLVAAFLSQPPPPQPAVHASNLVPQVLINPQPLPPRKVPTSVATTPKLAGSLTTAAPNQTLAQALPKAV